MTKELLAHRKSQVDFGGKFEAEANKYLQAQGNTLEAETFVGRNFRGQKLSWAETFAGRNFREFRVFCIFRESFCQSRI